MSRNQRDESDLPGTGRTEANGSGHDLDITTAVAPAGITTSTVAKWFRVNDGGTIYYIPMWT